jgi:hypothetical protein
MFGGRKITVYPGELVTTQEHIAKELKINRTTLGRILKEFKNEHQIDYQTSNRDTYISIKNWSMYQLNEHQFEHQMNIKRTSDEHEQEIKNIRTKEINTMSELKQANELFERLWKLYPVKKGKGQVSDAAKKRLLKIGHEELERAIDRYKMELEKDSDWRKPQNGSTFFNSGYVDYLDENYVPGEHRSDKQKKNSFNDFSQRDYNEKELENYFLQEVANMGRSDSG